MPKREASKCREWERERRERLKTCFDALAKLLPNHDPAIAPSKLEILQRAATYITDLQQKNKELENDDPQVTVAQRDETRKLRDRIRRLSSRAEQLAGLLRAAGLRIPKECNGVVFKGPPRLWSGKICREKAELLKKRHEEEPKISENTPNPSDKPPNKKKRKRVASPTKKALTLSENGLILGPVLKKLTLTANSTTVKVLSSRINRRQNASTRLSTTTSTTTNGVAARVGAVLGPGTLILADGSVVSVPAPRAAPPATLHRIQLLPVATASASPVILMQRNVTTGNNDSNLRHQPIRPKTALCRANRTNLIAKIPIPTLRSSRAIISRKKLIQQRKIDQKANKVNVLRKKSLVPTEAAKIVVENHKTTTASSNKISESNNVVTNKKVDQDVVKQNNTLSAVDKHNVKNVENTDKDVIIQNKENTNKVENGTKNTKIAVKNIETTSVVITVSTAEISNLQKGVKDDQKTNKTINNPEEKHSSKTYTEPCKNILSSTLSTTEIVPNEPKMITPDLKQNTTASDIQKELDNLSDKAKNQQQHCHHQDNQQILQETEEKIVQVHNEPQQQQPDESNQITDLNHQELQPQHQDEHHSELSNDIFASLQDGAGAGVIGGQHTESMSPTAAFLLAFPLVSTLTGGGRVNDGPNTHGSTNGDGRIINGSSNGNASGNNGSDDDGGRQGTPTTLLQIGGTISLDNGASSGNGQNKQRQIQLTNDDVPRSLDNFSFFTKEAQPYNTNRDHTIATSLEPIISHACLYEQQATHVSNPSEPAALPNISYYTDASVAFSNNPFTELRPQTEHQSSNQQHHSGYSCLAKEKNSGGKQRMNKNQQQQYRAPVNWMTSPDVRPTYTHQHYQHASTSSSFNTSDYFLPPFSDVYGNNSSLDHNLSAEHPPFTWSPTAGRSALPTLIGDLALGVTNSHNLEPSQQMDASAKDNSGASAPFLSVSSLVNGNKQRKQSSSQQSTKRHREKTAKNRANNHPNNPPPLPNNPNTHTSTQSTQNNSVVTNSSIVPLVPIQNTAYSGANSNSTNNLKRSDNQRHINSNNNNVNPFMDNINNSVAKRSANVSYLENMKRSDNNNPYTTNNNAINAGNQNNNNSGAIGMNVVNTSVKRNDNTSYHLDNNMLKRTDHTSYADASVHNNSVNVKRTNNTSYIDNTVNTALKSIRNFLDNSVKQPDNSFIDNSVKRSGGPTISYLDNSVKRSDNSFIDNTIKRSENYLENAVKRTDNSYLDNSATNVKRSLAGGYSAEALIAGNNSTIQQQNNHHQAMYPSYDQRSSSYALPPGGVTGSNNCTIQPNTQHHQNQNQHHYQQQIPHQQQIQPPHQHQQHRNNVHPFHVNQNTRHPINNNSNNSGSVNNNQQNLQHQSVHHQNNQHININMSASSSLTSSSFPAQPVSISSSAPPPSSLRTAAPSFGHMPSTVVTTASIAPSYVAAPPLGAPPREFSALLSAAVVDTYSKPFDSFVHVKPPVPVPPPSLVATTLTMTTATTSISTPGSFDSYCGINTNNTHSSRPHMGSSDNTDRRRHSSRRSNNNASNTNNNINSTSTAGPFAESNFLSMTGSVNSPLLQDDFHAAPFLSNALPVPPVPPPMPPTGSSLTNFNVSAIFPEINKVTASLPVTTWPSTKPSSSRSHARYHQHNQIMHSHNHHPQGHTQHQQQHRNNSDHTGQTNSSGYRQHGHPNQHSTHQQFTPDPMYSVASHSSAANSNIMPHHQVQPFPSSTSATLPTGAPDVPSAAPPSTFSFSFTTP